MVKISMELSYREALGNEKKKKERERESRTFLLIHAPTLLTVTAAADFNVM